jgi:hypothetical protein
MQASVNASAGKPIRRFTGQHYKLPPITLASLAVEWLVIFVFAFSFTALYRDPDPTKKLYGGEAEWLTSHPYLAAKTMKDLGRIVYWQPLLAYGEPLIDNPFSSLLNPVSTLPVLQMGGEMGIRFSVFLYALIAGYGGWALARVLGLGFLGRALLGLLLIGKGNMLANIGTGYYQLGVTQAYMPWVIAGALGILRLQKRRWPIILTVVALTLMFWGGNIWHTLPMLIMVGLLTLTHIFDIRREEGKGLRIKVDMLGIRRMITAAIFTIGLAMVSLLPIWAHQNRIANHPNEKDAGVVVDLGKVLTQYVDGDLALYYDGRAPSGEPQFYYSFVAPFWFVVLFCLVLPPLPFLLYRNPQKRYWRIIIVAVFMAIFATIWGAGGNPIMIFLYKNIPLLGQWRFVGRALGTATFAIAMLLAIRVDGLWRAVITEERIIGIVTKRIKAFSIPIRGALALALCFACYSAAVKVNESWFLIKGQDVVDKINDVCVTWLRAANPGRELALYGPGYYAFTTYIQNKVRLFNVAADFRMIPDPPTLYKGGDLTRTLPEFGLAWENGLRSYFRENSFINLDQSPAPIDSNHCIWRNPDAIPYAFTVPTALLENLPPQFGALKADMVSEIPEANYERKYDNIGLVVESDPKQELVVTVQETTYPGWRVFVDGKRAILESIAGELGVRIAPNSGQHFVWFQYWPDLLFIGGIVTLVTWILCILYLLHADRLIPESVFRRVEKVTAAATTATARVMFNPNIFTPKDDDGQPIPLLPPVSTVQPEEPPPLEILTEEEHAAQQGRDTTAED